MVANEVTSRRARFRPVAFFMAPSMREPVPKVHPVLDRLNRSLPLYVKYAFLLSLRVCFDGRGEVADWEPLACLIVAANRIDDHATMAALDPVVQTVAGRVGQHRGSQETPVEPTSRQRWGSNGNQSEEQPTPKAGAKTRDHSYARQVGGDGRQGAQKAIPQGELAPATQQEGPGR